MLQIYIRKVNFSFIHSSMALQPFFGPWPLLQFRNLFYTEVRIPWTSDQPVARPLPTHSTTQTQNKRTQTSMLWVVFEPTISAFERTKTVHASDRSATVIARKVNYSVWIPVELTAILIKALYNCSASLSNILFYWLALMLGILEVLCSILDPKADYLHLNTSVVFLILFRQMLQ
jgi:hypothetical protein